MTHEDALEIIRLLTRIDSGQALEIIVLFGIFIGLVFRK
jgi:hypothetical protein